MYFSFSQLISPILNVAFFTSQGYIIQKKEKRPNENEEFFTNQEFHPMIFSQHKDRPFIEYESFDRAVDEFFSNLEGQKIDIKGVQQVRHVHESNLKNLPYYLLYV